METPFSGISDEALDKYIVTSVTGVLRDVLPMYTFFIWGYVSQPETLETFVIVAPKECTLVSPPLLIPHCGDKRQYMHFLLLSFLSTREPELYPTPRKRRRKGAIQIFMWTIHLKELQLLPFLLDAIAHIHIPD